MNFLNYIKGSVNKITYTGASVTVQQDGYRSALHKLMERHAEKPLEQLVNGVGGVGSLFCLMNDSVVFDGAVKELIFYECFTGDVNRGITPKELLKPILNEYCRRNNGAPLVFILNYRHDKKYEDMVEVKNDYISVANEVGAVVVDVFTPISSRLQDGKYTVEELYRDGVHPTKIGAEVIAEIIWDQLLQENVNPLAAKESGSSLWHKEIVFNLKNAKFTSAAALYKTLGTGEIGRFEYKNTGQFFEYLDYDRLELKLTENGLVLGFLGLIGPRSPLFVNFEVAGRVFKLRTFDRNCFYTRPQTFSALHFEGIDGSVMSVSEELPDFSVCNRSHPDFDLPRTSSIVGFYTVNGA